MASNIHVLTDTSELIELFKLGGLYLKPIARLNISVGLPQSKEPGKSVSNWDLMEKLKKMVRPHQFASIKVSKSTIEFVRFEAEVESRVTLDAVIPLLDNSSIKLIGFFDILKVRASEAKVAFPSKHDWDSFFRDAKNMDEMHAGERPDTIYFANLPSKWFEDLAHKTSAKEAPSETTLRRIFETFGEVRCVDIPSIDPYRKEMSSRSSGIQVFGSFGQDLTFEAYVQYVEYIGFVKAMDALRGMKLVHVDLDGKAMAANVKIDFDRSKHLSDRSIRRRRIERDRLIQIEKALKEKVRREKEEEERRKQAEIARQEEERLREENEKLSRRRQREEKRRLRALQRKREEEESYIERRIKLEERKYLVAQRKLESVRLLSEIIKRVQFVKQKEAVENELRSLEEAKLKELEQKKRMQKEEELSRQRLLTVREQQLRAKLQRSVREREEKRKEMRRQAALDKLAKGKGALPSVSVVASLGSNTLNAQENGFLSSR